MAKVRAIYRGYVGGMIREPGDVFDWPEGVKLGSWVEPARVKAEPFGGKGDHDGDGNAGGAAPALTIPADWQNMSAADMKALAKLISGENVPNKTEAEKVITAHLDANKPEVFSDAPPAQTVQTAQQGLAEAGAGPAPDWVAPGTDVQHPVQADDE